MMVMFGNGSLLSVLLDEQAYNIEPEPQFYTISVIAILLGFYLLRIANKESII